MGGGGGYYDRDVYESDYRSSSSGFSHSYEAEERLFTPKRAYTPPSYTSPSQPATPPKPVKPRPKLSPLNRRLVCPTAEGVCVAADVTNSMSDALKVFWDKMPMFYGELVGQKYLADFSISFAAFGDIDCDREPLQVGEFAASSELDKILEGILLENGGGPGIEESPEMLAYYYLNCVDYPKMPEGSKPYIFFITNEKPHATLRANDLAKHLGGTHKATTTKEVFEKLAERYHAYVILTAYNGGGYPQVDEEVHTTWKQLLPNVANLKEPKGLVDLILGLISTTGGTRTVESYVADMQARGQTEQRIENIRNSLAEAAITSRRL